MEAKDLIDALIADGMTQQEIAARTGMTQPTISKITRGAVADVLSRSYRSLLALHAERFGSPGAPAVEAASSREA